MGMTNNSSNNNNNDQPNPQNISGPQAKKIGIEYGDLMIAKDISEKQENRIIQILELALVNEEVDFWVSHLTSIRGMEAGLLTKTAQKEYDDQKALLREHLGNQNLPPIRGLAAQNITTRLQSQMGQESLEKIFSAAKNLRKPQDSK